jgi:hypothetical protein
MLAEMEQDSGTLAYAESHAPWSMPGMTRAEVAHAVG